MKPLPYAKPHPEPMAARGAKNAPSLASQILAEHHPHRSEPTKNRPVYPPRCRVLCRKSAPDQDAALFMILS